MTDRDQAAPPGGPASGKTATRSAPSHLSLLALPPYPSNKITQNKVRDALKWSATCGCMHFKYLSVCDSVCVCACAWVCACVRVCACACGACTCVCRGSQNTDVENTLHRIWNRDHASPTDTHTGPRPFDALKVCSNIHPALLPPNPKPADGSTLNPLNSLSRLRLPSSLNRDTCTSYLYTVY